MPAIPLCLLQNLLPLPAHLLTVGLQLGIGCLAGRLNLRFADALTAAQLLVEPLYHVLRAVNRQERLNEINIVFLQNIHIAPDIFCIGSHYRAVEMII